MGLARYAPNSLSRSQRQPKGGGRCPHQHSFPGRTPLSTVSGREAAVAGRLSGRAITMLPSRHDDCMTSSSPSNRAASSSVDGSEMLESNTLGAVVSAEGRMNQIPAMGRDEPRQAPRDRKGHRGARCFARVLGKDRPGRLGAGDAPNRCRLCDVPEASSWTLYSTSERLRPSLSSTKNSTPGGGIGKLREKL